MCCSDRNAYKCGCEKQARSGGLVPPLEAEETSLGWLDPSNYPDFCLLAFQYMYWMALGPARKERVVTRIQAKSHVINNLSGRNRKLILIDKNLCSGI